MKWLFAILVAVAAHAETSATLEASIRKNCAIHRWRIIGGEVIDLAPIFKELTDSIYQTKFGDWELIMAKVVQISETDGIIFERILASPTADERVFRLKNYPGQKYLVDNTPIGIFAHREQVNFSYVSTAGARRTIRSYDYGKIPEDATLSRLQAENLHKLELAREEREKEIERLRGIETARRAAQVPKIIAYQMERASNGYPSFQFELGKRYLLGDGVPQDKRLAKFWLQSACTNGLSEATNLLAKIPLTLEIVTDGKP